MTILAILACLLREPTRCEHVRIPLAATMRQCASVAGMTELAKWSGEHPGLVIRRFQCEDGEDA